MIITCPRCATRYRYDEERFGGAAVKRVKCTGCSNVFEISNPIQDPGDATGVAARTSQAPAVAEPEADGEVRSSVNVTDLPALPPLPGDTRFSLAVIAGSQAGSVYPITRPRVLIGRGSGMDVQLRDSEASRRHAMLEIRGEEATLVDLGATNGTFLDGEQIDRAEIGTRSEFTVGSTTLMFIVTPTRDEA